MKLFHGVDDRLERLRIVHGEVREYLAVQRDSALGELAHELGIGDPVLTHTGIDALDPKGAEIALLVSAVPIGVGESLLVGVLRYCPDILPGQKITARSLENLLAASPGGY